MCYEGTFLHLYMTVNNIRKKCIPFTAVACYCLVVISFCLSVEVNLIANVSVTIEVLFWYKCKGIMETLILFSRLFI